MSTLSDLQNLLSGFLSDPESLRLVFPAVFGSLALMLGIALALVITGLADPVKKRIGAVKEDRTATTKPNPFIRVMQHLGRVLTPKQEKKRANVASQLVLAGYRSANAFRFFFAFRLIGMIGIPLLIFAWAGITGQLSLRNAMLYSVAGAAIAYILPDVWLARRVRSRQERLRRALPDVLDLLVVCTEAGLGLNAGIQRVADEMEIQHPEMSDELRLVTMQIRAGMDSRSALTDLQSRTGLDDIRSFVTTLLQSMRFGTSIADSLRVFSEDMRDKRLQRAQEKAAKLSVKMLGPIALFIMPAFLLVAIGPAVFSLLRALGQIM